MAGRRTWLRAGAWLALILLLAGTLGWYAGQRWLREQGIQLEWRGLGLSADGFSLRHLELHQRDASGAEWHARAERLRLDWDYLPLHLHRLHIERLLLDRQTDAKRAEPPAAIDVAALREQLSYLPRDLHIEHLQATLPCPSGRCELTGGLRLRHTGRLFPAHLEAQLEHRQRQLQLVAQLQGELDAARLDLSLAIDQQPRLALTSELQRNSSGWLWSGRLELPELPEAAWLLGWLDEWHGPSPQVLAAPPDALRLHGDWHLQLPAAPSLASLEQASGSANFEARLPVPWPLPGVGHLQGKLSMALTANSGRWFPNRVESELELSQPSNDWLVAVPESLRPSALQLRIKPGTQVETPSSLPIFLHLSAQGNAALTLEGGLAITRQPPWSVELSDARLHGRIAQLPLAETELHGLELDLRAEGRLDDEQFTLSFAPDSRALLDQARAGQGLSGEKVEAELDGLRMQGRHTEGSVGSLNVQGPLRLQAGRIVHPRLHPQGWRWQGDLQANLQRLGLSGTLSADSGLNLALELEQILKGGLRVEARLPEIFFRASNPLAKTLIDWPAVLEFKSGRLQGKARLGLAGGNTPAEGQLQLTFKGLSGTYDRSELSGLDGRLELRLQANRLHLAVPELHLEQANPGISIGPLRLQADYSAALQQPLAGRLEWQLAESAFLGGKVWLEPGSWTLSESSGRVPVHLQGLDLEHLLLAYPAEGLEGTGQLDGLLPMHLSPAGVRIEDGSLAARPPGGRLQFRSERIQALGRSNPAMRLVTEALANFHYSRLSSEVSYDEQGTLLLNLRLEGRNPEIERGRPIHFNINLEEDVPALLTSLQLSDRVNQTIQRRVQEYLRQQQSR